MTQETGLDAFILQLGPISFADDKKEPSSPLFLLVSFSFSLSHLSIRAVCFESAKRMKLSLRNASLRLFSHGFQSK